MTTQAFWRWFELEMVRHGYRSVRQVERAGDVGNDTISGRQRRGMAPTDTVIRAIAQAFDLPFEAVSRIAEDSETESGDSARDATEEERLEALMSRETLTLRELWGIVSEMPIEDQRAVLDYALFRRSRSDERRAEEPQRGRAANPPAPAATDAG